MTGADRSPSAPPAPRFFKMSAGGNDFIVVDAVLVEGWAWTPDEIHRACKRRLSVGADGVVVLQPSDRATARFLLWNADGSSAAFSGNGARCAARVLHLLGRSTDGALSLETLDGVVPARVIEDATGQVAVELGLRPPHDERYALALPPRSPAPTGDFAVAGVPYLAVPVEDVDALDLAAVAPPLRRWSAFPAGANVAFYEPPRGGEPVRLRTWERGIEGETLSSGTGCLVVALSVARRQGRLSGDGEIHVRFAPRSGLPMAAGILLGGGAIRGMTLLGDARHVAEMLLGPDALTGFRA